MSLDIYLADWSHRYKEALNQIKLFDTEKVAHLTSSQRDFFVGVFYHARAHFYKFLWVMGSYIAFEPRLKEIILHNIAEEFGGKRLSHELLFGAFAEHFRIDIRNEFLTGAHLLPCIDGFNQGHIAFLLHQKTSYQAAIAAFYGYEWFDNLDYEKLLLVAKALGVTGHLLDFFVVHTQVNHHGPAYELLQEAWEEDSAAVKYGLEFILQHQINMWVNLGLAVFKHKQ